MAKSWDSLTVCENMVKTIQNRSEEMIRQNNADRKKIFEIAQKEQNPFISNKILDHLSKLNYKRYVSGYLKNIIKAKNDIFINLHKKYGNYTDFLDFHNINIIIYDNMYARESIDINMECEINNRIFDFCICGGVVFIDEYNNIHDRKEGENQILDTLIDDFSKSYDKIYDIIEESDDVNKLIKFLRECNNYTLNY